MYKQIFKFWKQKSDCYEEIKYLSLQLKSMAEGRKDLITWTPEQKKKDRNRLIKKNMKRRSNYPMTDSFARNLMFSMFKISIQK